MIQEPEIRKRVPVYATALRFRLRARAADTSGSRGMAMLVAVSTELADLPDARHESKSDLRHAESAGETKRLSLVPAWQVGYDALKIVSMCH